MKGELCSTQRKGPATRGCFFTELACAAGPGAGLSPSLAPRSRAEPGRAGRGICAFIDMPERGRSAEAADRCLFSPHQAIQMKMSQGGWKIYRDLVQKQTMRV